MTKKLFPETIIYKIFALTLVFIRNSAQQGNFNLFFKRFLLVLRKFAFWQEDGALGYYYYSF